MTTTPTTPPAPVLPARRLPMTPGYLLYIGPDRARAELAALPLIDLQHTFARLLPWLLDEAHRMGYEVTLGECWRPRETRRRLHSHRLAVDLNLFRDGQYLTNTQDHAPLGAKWESIGGAWGGRFNDGNHYSLAWGGMK